MRSFSPRMNAPAFLASLVAVLVLGLGPAAAPATAQPATTPLFWPDKQGPTRNGVVPQPDAAKLPLEWDEAAGKGIAWKTPLEGEGHSTPVIGGDLIWFTAATTDGKKMYVYGINRHDGKVLHHKLLFENESPEELGNPINNYAAPSPVLEDDALYVHFGTYGTARLDPKTGEVVWQRRDIKAKHWRGPGSSPVIFENLLILTFDAVDQQFTIALDKKTGRDAWRTPRSTDFTEMEKTGIGTCPGDRRKAFGTPALVSAAGMTQVVSVGAGAVQGYDARTGKEVWILPHDTYNAAVRPLVRGDTVYINTGNPRGHLVALKIDANTKGDVSSRPIWDHAKLNSELSSGALVNDHIFYATGAAVGVCVNVKDGSDAWSERLFTSAGKIISSAMATTERVYFFSESGDATVIAAAPQFKVLARNKLQSGMTASPAEADGALFLRAKTHLYKVVK